MHWVLVLVQHTGKCGREDLDIANFIGVVILLCHNEFFMSASANNIHYMIDKWVLFAFIIIMERKNTAEFWFKQVIWAKLMRCTTALAVPNRRLSWSISYPFWHNSLLKSTPQQQIAKKPLKPPFQKFKVIDVRINKKLSLLLVVMISSMSLPICNRSHATPANSGK